MAYQFFYSERHIPLIFHKDRSVKLSRPVLTVENYLKWYNLYVVNVNETVEAVTSGLFDCPYDVCPSPSGDHNFHPVAVQWFVDKNDWSIDPTSLDAIAGRWAMEQEDKYHL